MATQTGSQAGAATTPAPRSPDRPASSSGARTSSQEPPQNAQPGNGPSEQQPTRRERRQPQTDSERTDAIAELLGRAPEASAADRAKDLAQEGEERDSWVSPPETGDGAVGDAHEAGEGALPGTLSELSERLGLKPEQVYDLELTTGDGETVKLGALKDAWQDRQAEARETAKRAKALDEREAALVADRQLWDAIGTELQSRISPQLARELRGRMSREEGVEREKLMAAMPELKDPETLTRFNEKFLARLQKYGFTGAEIRVTDHRNVLLVRDLMRAEERLEKLLSYEPPKDPPKSQPSQGRSSGPSSTERQRKLNAKARSGTEADKVKAVSALLNR
jgi:hypothetical protein